MGFSILFGQSPKLTTHSRNHACTHFQMTRLFDLYGCDRCSICHKRPSLGWLYRCTQDLGGCLPASDFYNVEDTLTRPEQDVRMYTLSPSISKAIVDGHYTDAEVLRLVQQKEYVRQTILSNRPSTSSDSTSTNSSYTTLPESQTSSSISSSINDLMREICFDPVVKRPLTPIYETQNGQEERIVVAPVDMMLTKPVDTSSLCNFKVCQTCRPVYRDRAWASINTMLSSPCSLPPPYEFDNRRISDVKVVKVMSGLKWGTRHCAFQQWDIDNDKSKRSSRAEFQDTVRRMLRNNQPSGGLEDDVTQTSSMDDVEPHNYKIKNSTENFASNMADNLPNLEPLHVTTPTDSIKSTQSERPTAQPLYQRQSSELLSSSSLPPPSTVYEIDDVCLGENDSMVQNSPLSYNL